MQNVYKSMPSYPYKILLALLSNENIWKLLKYNTRDCLSKPDLSKEEKLALLWNGEKAMEDCNIFLTNNKFDIMTDSKSVLLCYRNQSIPRNLYTGVICYQFDILYGTKTAMVNYGGIPCNRGDIFEAEILQTLNNKDVAGVGNLQYNRELTTSCGSVVGIGDKDKFSGVSIVMATMSADMAQNECEYR